MLPDCCRIMAPIESECSESTELMMLRKFVHHLDQIPEVITIFYRI